MRCDYLDFLSEVYFIVLFFLLFLGGWVLGLGEVR